MNYVRLINGAFSTKPISEWEEPDRIPWQAIMGRAGNIYENYDEFMDAEGHRDWPSIAVYFYRDEWIMGDIEYQQALFEEIYKHQYNPIIFMVSMARIARRYSEYEAVHEPSFWEG